MTSYNINRLRHAISEIEKNNEKENLLIMLNESIQSRNRDKFNILLSLLEFHGILTNQLHKIYAPEAQIPAEHDPKVQKLLSLINKFEKEEKSVKM